MATATQPTVPHLTTALTGPLRELEKCLLKNEQTIERWFTEQWQAIQPAIYGSVDLRNAGFKVAPVDTNLFPAGFNNLNPDFWPLCVEAIQKTLTRLEIPGRRVLLIPESHTRNQKYLENVEVLRDIFKQAGCEVVVALLTALTREGDQLSSEGFVPDLILLNHDLSSEIPEILKGVSQKILPPISVGWSTRLKSSHFKVYERISRVFAEQIGLDPWLLSPLFRNCGQVDFMKREGEDCLVHNAGLLLKAIQHKYDEYEVKEAPFVVVKADAGTYGMAVMTVKSIDDVRDLNRKQRSHMAKTKGGQVVTQVIVQEGVYSFETWEKSVAEPVVYVIGEKVVGGFYRVHKTRGPNENLNSPGMDFKPLSFVDPCCEPADNRFYAYGVIARLAMLAAANEAL